MRIGVVTVQDSNNFGSFLQAYALQYVLKEMGHDVCFIRSRSKKYIKNIFYRIIPNRNEVFHILRFVKNNWTGWKKYRRFQKEQSYFRTIDKYDNSMLDLVILGSDEIWNAENAVFRRPIFYGENMDPVMAYAVSIGNASFDKMKIIPNKSFENIYPIYARDKHTVGYLETLDIDSSIVCDPTLLVSKEVFYRNFDVSKYIQEPYILVYSYGLSNEMRNAICMFAQKNNLKVVSTCFPFEGCDCLIDCAALDFCAVLEKAEYVFTSTFHGTIFSILNHKKFVSLPQSRKTSDLLACLNLSNRLTDKGGCSTEQLEEKLVRQQINYDEVDRIIESMRKDSLLLLKKGLDYYESKCNV